MKHFRIKKSFLLILNLMVFWFSSAENFRVHDTVIASMENQIDIIDANISMNDALFIRFPDDVRFLKGLEFEITIPQEVAQYGGAVAWSFYENIYPLPQDDSIDYRGERLYINTLPGTLSYNFRLPLIQEHGLVENPYSQLLDLLYTTNSNGIFLRLQLAMKGASQAVYNAQFKIEIKPILSDEGLLDVSLLYPQKRDSTSADITTIFIDEKEVGRIIGKDQLDVQFLKSGEHHISIVSNSFRNEVRTFTISQAKTTQLEISLKDIAPTLLLTAPLGTIIKLDDVILENNNSELVLSAGEHRVKFIIGDYELVKIIKAENGKSYTASVLMDVEITEE